MADFKNNDITINLSNQIWKLFDNLRGTVPTEDFSFLLYLLSAFNDGLLKNIQSIYHSDLNHDIIRAIKQSEKYHIVSEIYEPIINFIPPQNLENILNSLNTIDRFELESNFKEVFDFLLYRLSDMQGKHSGEFIQPLEVSRFIMNLANLPDNATVYNPFAGVASLGTFLNKTQRYYAQEINRKTWALGILRLMAFNNIDYRHYDLDNSIEHWNNFGEFDLIVSNPPFGLRVHSNFNNVANTVELFLIERAFERLPKGGKLICVLPLGFLFSSGKGKTFRERLIKNGFIDTIIELPEGIFRHTSISTCIIVFKKSLNQHQIRFVDATKLVISEKSKIKRLDDERLLYILSSNIENAFVKYVSISEIKKNEYTLTVKRYFAKEFTGVPLREFTTYLRGTISHKNEIGKFVKVRDLKDSVFDNMLDLDKIEESELRYYGIRKIEESCILVATKWKTLKPTYFKFEGKEIYINNDIVALRTIEELVTIQYLLNELHYDVVKEQLKSYRIGTIIPSLRKDDLLSIKIPLPSLEEQKAIFYASTDRYLKASLEQSLSVINESKITVEDENSFLRHQIAGSLKNVRGSFKLIKQILDEKVKPGFPNLYDLKADNQLSSTLLNYLNDMERDIISITKSVNQAGDKIDLMDLNIENFDLLIFLEEYKESLKLRAKNFYSIEFDPDKQALKQYAISSVNIKGDKDILRKMLDNIIENAEKHAFEHKIQSTEENKIIIQLLYNIEDFTVQVDISNTGTPLPKNITHDTLIRKGSSSGRTAGSGTGCWYVNEVMKIHNGTFGFTDETGHEGIDGEFVTTFELTFPIIPAI